MKVYQRPFTFTGLRKGPLICRALLRKKALRQYNSSKRARIFPASIAGHVAQFKRETPTPNHCRSPGAIVEAPLAAGLNPVSNVRTVFIRVLRLSGLQFYGNAPFRVKADGCPLIAVMERFGACFTGYGNKAHCVESGLHKAGSLRRTTLIFNPFFSSSCPGQEIVSPR